MEDQRSWVTRLRWHHYWETEETKQTPKSFCLFRLNLSTFTVLEIKVVHLLRTVVLNHDANSTIFLRFSTLICFDDFCSQRRWDTSHLLLNFFFFFKYGDLSEALAYISGDVTFLKKRLTCFGIAFLRFYVCKYVCGWTFTVRKSNS